MIVDGRILGTRENRSYGPTLPTPERALHIRVDEEPTITVGPRDEDAIRTVRITSEVVPTCVDLAAITTDPGHRAPETRRGD